MELVVAVAVAGTVMGWMGGARGEEAWETKKKGRRLS